MTVSCGAGVVELGRGSANHDQMGRVQHDEHNGGTALTRALTRTVMLNLAPALHPVSTS